MSPAPRKKPAAFAKVGAAAMAVAANAFNIPRREMPVELDSVILSNACPVVAVNRFVAACECHPQMQEFYGITGIVNQALI